MNCHSAVATHLDTKKVVFGRFLVRLFLTPVKLKVLVQTVAWHDSGL